MLKPPTAPRRPLLSGPLPARWPSPVLLMPLLFGLSLVVFFVAPAGSVERLTPTVGTIGLLIECGYLSWLALRMRRHLLQRFGSPGEASGRRRLRRVVAPALNALIGFWIFTLGFYPLAHRLLDGEHAPELGPLLWMFTVGGAIVAIGFGQLVAQLLQTLAPDPAS